MHLAPIVMLVLVGSGSCIDAGDPLGDSGAPDLPCMSTQKSTLPGASIVFPDQPCVFTLAQAAAGIEITYDTVIEPPALGMSLTARAQDSGCGTPEPSGLIVFERLHGNSQSYCLCDVGLCLGGDIPTGAVEGVHEAMFTWMGRNWIGPSDFGNPMGEPFPPGSYTLTVSAIGTRASADYLVEGTFAVHIVP